MEKLEGDPSKKLLQEIQEVIEKKASNLWGHGTISKDLAEKIINEGIECNPGYNLDNIAIPITDQSKNPEENSQEILNKAAHWPHKDAKFIVLINVPAGFKPDDVLEETDVDGRPRTKLSQERIVGYIDALNFKLVPNPTFDESAEPSGYKFLADARPRLFGKKPDQKVDIPQTGSDNSEAVW